jgi:hypothetical protein
MRDHVSAVGGFVPYALHYAITRDLPRAIRGPKELHSLLQNERASRDTNFPPCEVNTCDDRVEDAGPCFTTKQGGQERFLWRLHDRGFIPRHFLSTYYTGVMIDQPW